LAYDLDIIIIIIMLLWADIGLELRYPTTKSMEFMDPKMPQYIYMEKQLQYILMDKMVLRQPGLVK